jgi:hypothetical protein
MAEQNGAGNDMNPDDAITAARDDGSSLNGFGPPEAALGDRPEVLIGAAVLGGLLLAGMVRRFGR